MDELHRLEAELFAKAAVPLREIKKQHYDSHKFEGVYLIYRAGHLVKIGKTSGRKKKIERKMADRICGLTYADSVLRITLSLTLDDVHECTAKCLEVDDALMRGRLECYLMAKYHPEVNHAELRR